MRHVRYRRRMVRYRSGSLPEDVQRHMERCPECREYYQHMARMGELVALKRYEQPSAIAEQRMRAAIKDRLAAAENPHPLTSPLLRIGLAAGLLLLVGLHVGLLSRGGAPEVEQDSPEPQVYPSLAPLRVVADGSALPTNVVPEPLMPNWRRDMRRNFATPLRSNDSEAGFVIFEH